MKKDIFKVAGKKLKSRLIVGTGKYKNMKECAKAIKLSGAEIAVIERVVTPGVMQAFGYKPESTSKAREDQSQAVIAKLRESEASQFPRETNSSRVMMHDLVQQRLRGA